MSKEKVKIRNAESFNSTRDFLRYVVKNVCDKLGIKDIDPYKLNSKWDCINRLIDIAKNYNNKETCKALKKEIQGLENDIALLEQEKKINYSNLDEANEKIKKLEAEQAFYITQAEEAGKQREKSKEYEKFYEELAKKWRTEFFELRFENIKLKKSLTKWDKVSKINGLIAFSILLATIILLIVSAVKG